MGRKLLDLTGQRFGRLVVTEYVGREHHSSSWRCHCDCGQEVKASAASLKTGMTLSCGCYRRDRMGALNFKHGERHSAEYKAWDSMRQRCSNKSDKAWKWYGGLGIKVCERWDTSFEAFLADMGRRPSAKHSIDRKEGNLGYEPGNCRWATATEQARNRSNNRTVLFAGKEMILVEAAEAAGIRYVTLKSRLQKGWTVERALNTPVDEAKRNAQRNSGDAGLAD